MSAQQLHNKEVVNDPGKGENKEVSELVSE